MIQQFALGIDLGGTNIKAVLTNPKGEVLEQISRPTNDEPGVDKSLWWKQCVKGLVLHFRGMTNNNIELVGIAAPGTANPENTAIIALPNRLIGMEHFIWQDYLGMETFVMNDAHAALFSESRIGIGKKFKNILMLTLGTGVGGGILMDGKLVQGQKGRAGHVGHISINQETTLGIVNTPGSLERAVGEYTLPERSHGKYSTTKKLVQAYLAGDPFASWVWLNSIQSLARGLVSLINVVSPELIILSGGITKAGDALLKPLNTFMEVYEWRIAGYQTPVKLATSNTLAGALGAALFAFEKQKKNQVE